VARSTTAASSEVAPPLYSQRSPGAATTRRHGERVAQREPALVLGHVGQQLREGLIDAPERAVRERDADERGGDALGDRAQVVEHALAEGDAGERTAEVDVPPFEILFEDQTAPLHDQH